MIAATIAVVIANPLLMLTPPVRSALFMGIPLVIVGGAMMMTVARRMQILLHMEWTQIGIMTLNSAATGENFVQNGAPEPPQSSSEISPTHDDSGADSEEDTGEHSPGRPAGTDPQADSPASGSPRRSASPAAASPCAAEQRPASRANPASPHTNPPSPRVASPPAAPSDPDSLHDDSAGSSAPTDSVSSAAASSADSESSAAGSYVAVTAAPPPPSPPGPRTRLQKGIRNPKKYTDGTV
nr:predicted GPI-anchored protein 58 [Lolium perenne]